MSSVLIALIVLHCGRCIAVHPTLPYILTSSDDMTIKLWDWDKGNVAAHRGVPSVWISHLARRVLTGHSILCV